MSTEPAEGHPGAEVVPLYPDAVPAVPGEGRARRGPCTPTSPAYPGSGCRSSRRPCGGGPTSARQPCWPGPRDGTGPGITGCASPLYLFAVLGLGR